MKKLLLLLFLLCPRPSFAAFTHYTTCTVKSGQIPAAHSKPFLSCGVIAETQFKTVGNGGHVASSSGFDIRPYITSCSGTALTYELVFYDGSAGTFEMHILPATSISDASVIYMCYGDSGLTTDGSSSSTWPSTYKGVWHWYDGTTLRLNDSTSNALNGSYVSSDHPAAVTGVIDGGLDYAHIDDAISVGTTAVPTTGSLDWWFYMAASQADGMSHPTGMQFSGASGAFYNFKYLDNSLYVGWYNFTFDARVVVANGSYTLNTSAWNHFVLTWDSTAPANKLYLNGTQIGSTNTANATFNSSGYSNIWGYNALIGVSVIGLDGLDEGKLLDTVMTANEIATEYNFTHSPTSFWTVSADNTIGGGGSSKQSTFTLLGVGR